MKKVKNARFSKSVNIQNKRANFEYLILDKYESGIVLKGTEIKSIREGKVGLKESYCYFYSGELWIKNMHVGIYEQGNIYNHEEKRDRKLLLHRKELNKLLKGKEKGFAIVALRLYINAKGLAKLMIALAQGKKMHDKRQAIKERDMKRELRRGLKND